MITPADLTSFLAPLEVEWPQVKFDAARMNLWHDALKHYRGHEIEKAVRSWVMQNKWFPKVAELIGKIQASRAQDASGAQESIHPSDRPDWADSLLACERVMEAMLNGDEFYIPKIWTGKREGQRRTYLFDIEKVARQAATSTLRWQESNPHATPEYVLTRGYRQVTHMAVQAAGRGAS